MEQLINKIIVAKTQSQFTQLDNEILETIVGETMVVLNTHNNLSELVFNEYGEESYNSMSIIILYIDSILPQIIETMNSYL